MLSHWEVLLGKRWYFHSGGNANWQIEQSIKYMLPYSTSSLHECVCNVTRPPRQSRQFTWFFGSHMQCLGLTGGNTRVDHWIRINTTVFGSHWIIRYLYGFKFFPPYKISGKKYFFPDFLRIFLFCHILAFWASVLLQPRRHKASESNQMASETPQVQTSSYPNSYMEKYGHIVDLDKEIESEHQHVLRQQPLYPHEWLTEYFGT